MTEQLERKSSRIAMITSLGVHAALLLLIFFLVAWRAPNPPLPEYGIELNFGMDLQGSGAVQPTTPAGPEQSEPITEEVSEELPVVEPQQPAEEVIEAKAPEETKVAEPEAVSKTESPVVVEEKKEVKPVEKPKEQPKDEAVKKPVEETQPEEKTEKEIPTAIYKPDARSKTPGNSDGKPVDAANQGDDANKTGDKGDPAGSLDAKALYGKQGGGGGGISMTGFNGFGAPSIETPSLPDESYGVYEFKVKVDDQGYVVSVTSVQRGLSFEAERRLKAAIQKLQFIPKGTNLPAQSEGTITFKVVSAKN